MRLNHLATVCLLIVVAACARQEENPITYYQVPGNPIFNEFNKPIDFKSLKPVHFRQASDSIIAHSNNKLQKLIALNADDRTFDNTMLALDDLYDGITRIGSLAHLMQSTHTDSLMRVEALQCATDLEKYENELSLNEDLYKAVKVYSESPDADGLKELYKKRFLDDVVKSFERNGFALP